MRRKDRAVTEWERQEEILKQCPVCRIGLVDGCRPYIIPMNYGWERTENALTVYLHCAKEGKKLDLLRENSAVCFEADCGYVLQPGEKACQYGCGYASVVGMGTAEIVTDTAEKQHGLSLLMRCLTDGEEFAFTPAEAESVCVVKLTLTQVTGKAKA